MRRKTWPALFLTLSHHRQQWSSWMPPLRIALNRKKAALNDHQEICRGHILVQLWIISYSLEINHGATMQTIMNHKPQMCWSFLCQIATSLFDNEGQNELTDPWKEIYTCLHVKTKSLVIYHLPSFKISFCREGERILWSVKYPSILFMGCSILCMPGHLHQIHELWQNTLGIFSTQKESSKMKHQSVTQEAAWNNRLLHTAKWISAFEIFRPEIITSASCRFFRKGELTWSTLWHCKPLISSDWHARENFLTKEVHNVHKSGTKNTDP